MLKIFFILSIFFWVLILFYQIQRRGYFIFLIWLLVAPVFTNMIVLPGQNPFIRPPLVETAKWPPDYWDSKVASTVTLQDMLEPTRNLVCLFMIAFLFEAVLRKKRLGPFDATEKFMCAFSVILIVSAILQSRRPLFGLHIASDSFIVPFLMYFIFRRLVINEERLRQLTRVFGFVGFYLIVICLIERLSTPEIFHRLSGPFKERDSLYVVIVVILFALLLDSMSNQNFHEKKNALSRYSRYFVISFIPIIISLTLTRGIWAGFISGMSVFLLLGVRLLNFSQKKGIFGITLMLIFAVAIFLNSFIPKKIIDERITKPANFYARVGAWQILLKESLQNPILGVGLNNSRDTLFKRKIYFKGAKSEITAHNSFIALWSELGIIGLFAYLGIAMSILIFGYRLYRRGEKHQDRWRGVVILALMAAYHVPANFAISHYIVGLIHVYLYALIGAIAGQYSRRQSVSSVLNMEDSRLEDLQMGDARPPIVS